MTLDSRPRGWPKLLIVAILIHAGSLIAMWSHGFPRTTSDSVTFKQAGYMRLHTPFFSIPTYRGLTEHGVDLIYSYPAPAYILFNYGVFKVFGFGLFTSLAADLVVHFVLVTLAAWWFWRLTGNSALAAILVLGMAHLYDPIGRPEEFGLLFSLCALISIAAEKPRYWLAIIFLALCGATTPGAAIAGTVQVLVYLALRNGLTPGFWGRAAMIAILSPAISLAIYFWYLSPYTVEGLLQLQHVTSIAVRESFPGMLGRDPLWIAFFILSFLAAVASATALVIVRPDWLPLDTQVGRLILVMTVGLLVNVSFNLAAGRPQYDFRFASAQCVGLLALILSGWLRHVPGKRPRWAIAALTGMIVLCILPHRESARYLLASVLWKSDAVTYDQAVAKIHALVPADATVGGDSAIWMSIDDGRPFYSIRWVSLDHWPEYIVTTQWTKIPYVFQVDHWRKKIAASYVEVTPGTAAPVEPCTCRIAGLRLPIATGRCDWDVRIWRRRNAGRERPPRQSSLQAHGLSSEASLSGRNDGAASDALLPSSG